MRVLVLGGYGDTGARIVSVLRARGAVVLVAGRDSRRADRVIDLRCVSDAALDQHVGDIDVVVNASGFEDAGLVARIAGRGAAVVDITASTSYVAALERLEVASPVLVSVGLAPGLTNLVAAAVHGVAPGPIDVAVFLGAGERHGGAAIEWVYGLLGRGLSDTATGESIRNFSRPVAFDLPESGRRWLYRADFSDQHVLTRELGDPVQTYLGLDSRLATGTLAALTWVPGARRLPRGLRFPGGDRWVVLARGPGGTRWVAGYRQSHATAVVAAAAVDVVGELSPGIHHLHRVMSLSDLPSDADFDLSGSLDSMRSAPQPSTKGTRHD